MHLARHLVFSAAPSHVYPLARRTTYLQLNNVAFPSDGASPMRLQRSAVESPAPPPNNIPVSKHLTTLCQHTYAST
jgi:hypothetical protein